MKNCVIITITTVFFLFMGFSAFAQRGQSVSVSSDEPVGLRVDVTDQDGALLRDAKVVFIMGKDTVDLKTNRQGRVYYSGPFRTASMTVVVSHGGYETQQREVKLPPPHLQHTQRFGESFSLAKKEETDTGASE